MKTGIFSLGTRKDATTWEKGCKALGFDAPTPIKKPNPGLEELKGFFRLSPDWVFLAGHFGGLVLSNESGSVEIEFKNDRVEISAEDKITTLKKGTSEFRVHEKCGVILWGGCSVCNSEDTVRTLRSLFGEHLLLGFAGLTGWRIVDAMLGGGFLKNHFFKRVKDHVTDPEKVRDAWMKTARAGYGNGKLEDRFRAFDPDGQEWILKNGKIIRGRKIS